jgi:hypothetical protein
MLLQLTRCCTVGNLLNFVLGAMEADTAQQDTGRILSIFLGFFPSMVHCVSWCLAFLRFLVAVKIVFFPNIPLFSDPSFFSSEHNLLSEPLDISLRNWVKTQNLKQL